VCLALQLTDYIILPRTEFSDKLLVVVCGEVASGVVDLAGFPE
jgi:hypothetical protein